MKTILNFVSNLSLIQWLLFSIIPVFITIVTVIQRYFRLQLHLAKNLKRRIYIFSSEMKPMQIQFDNLHYLKFLKIDDKIRVYDDSSSILERLKDNSIFIVGYDEGKIYENLLFYARSKKIPIIFFANPGEMDKGWKIVNDYVLCDVVNSTNRLSTVVLDMMRIA